MISRRSTPRDPQWEDVSGGILRDENGFALIRLEVKIDGQRVGQVITILHERVHSQDEKFRKTLDHMVRDIDIKIKYRLEK